MDLASKKLPALLIIVLGGILVAQIVVNSPEETLVDPETCEIYVVDERVGGVHYTGEIDPDCTLSP